MKLKNIFISLMALLGLAVSCQKEELGSLEGIKVDKSYVSLPLAGGTQTITVTANADWAFDAEQIAKYDWLTVTPTSGTAGETKVTFTAPETLDGKGTITLSLVCGKETQLISVIQGLKQAAPSTCKEAMEGPEKTYRVSGVVTRIVNTTYGNLYIDDGSGVEGYIYGTLDAKGAEKNFLSLGIEVGDEITVEGPKQWYGTTAELVNVTVIKIVKSLLKTTTPKLEVPKEGGVVIAKFIVSGSDFTYDLAEAEDWISIAGQGKDKDTTTVSIKIAENKAAARKDTLYFSSSKGSSVSTIPVEISQAGSIIYKNCSELNAAILSGVTDFLADFAEPAEITFINGTSDMYVQDATGAVYVYSKTLVPALKTAGAQAGAAITGAFSGKATLFSGLPEITEITQGETFKMAWGGKWPCKNLTVAEILADASKYMNMKVKVTGVEVTDAFSGSDRSGKVKQDAAEIAVYMKDKNLPDAATVGQKGDICGYVGINNGTIQINYWENGKWVPKQEGGSSDTPVIDPDPDAPTPTSELFYTLAFPKNGANTDYKSTYDVTVDGVTWNVPGNQSLDAGLKLGGKLAAATDRAIYSKGLLSSDTNKVIVYHGSGDDAITVNSMTLAVFSTAADAAAGTNALATMTGTYANNGTTEFVKTVNADISKCYFRLTYNMSSTAPTSNKGIIFQKAEFYK